MTSTKSSTETTTMTTTTTPSESFGQRLRRLRKSKGLTQAELAYRVGMHELSISRYELDKRQPQVEEVRKLAEALGVPQSELLEASPLPPNRWVLTVRIVDGFKEEVIDLSKAIPTVSCINTTPTGGFLTLGGSYELWTDNRNFKRFIDDIKKYRNTVIQNGIALGGIKGANN